MYEARNKRVENYFGVGKWNGCGRDTTSREKKAKVGTRVGTRLQVGINQMFLWAKYKIIW